MIDLPYDVWLHVASHLPIDALNRLLTLNHAFFDFVIDKRYRDVTFRYRRIEDDDGLLRELQNPSAALRVRTLRFNTGVVLRRPPQPRKTRLFDRIKGILKYLRMKKRSTSAPAITSNFKTSADGVDKFISAFDMMTELSTFHLYCCHWQCGSKYSDYLPIVKAGWMAFGSNLRELRLDAPLQTLTHILSPSLKFNRLESIDINIQRAHIESNIADMTDLLAPFINNHQPTLESFKITKTSYDLPKTDISHLLLGLRHFPRLTAINLDASLAPSGFGHFLGLHAQSLLDLAVMHHYTGSYDTVELPYVRSLHLGLDHIFPGIPQTASYLRRFAKTLTSLTLSGYECHYCDAKEVIEAFAGEGRLRNLTVQLDFLTPQILDLMAEKLSGLDKVEVRIRGYQDLETEGDYIESQEGFCKQMSQRTYPDWKLRQFRVTMALRTPSDIDKCNAVLKTVIPGFEVALWSPCCCSLWGFNHDPL